MSFLNKNHLVAHLGGKIDMYTVTLNVMTLAYVIVPLYVTSFKLLLLLLFYFIFLLFFFFNFKF